MIGAAIYYCGYFNGKFISLNNLSLIILSTFYNIFYGIFYLLK